MRVKIEEHTRVNKSFDIELQDLDFKIRIDYDDVDHEQTDAVASYIKTLIQKHWDEQEFIDIFTSELVIRWNEDTPLRQEYLDDIDSYLDDRLPKPDPTKDFKDIVINTKDRFIGWYGDNRLSAIRLEDNQTFDYDVKGRDSFCFIEEQQKFDDMNALLVYVKNKLWL